MVKTVYSDDLKDLKTIDPLRIVLVDDLEPFVSDKKQSGFPSLSMNIYKCCLRNKCKYRKVNYVSLKTIRHDWAMLFDDKKTADNLRDH